MMSLLHQLALCHDVSVELRGLPDVGKSWQGGITWPADTHLHIAWSIQPVIEKFKACKLSTLMTSI
jgi:hypothetical protein